VEQRWLQITTILNLLKVQLWLWSIYDRKSCKLQASCFDALDYVSLLWGQNRAE
jgi:hypothetical protein